MFTELELRYSEVTLYEKTLKSLKMDLYLNILYGKEAIPQLS